MIDFGKVVIAVIVGSTVWGLTGILPLGFVAGFGLGIYLLSR